MDVEETLTAIEELVLRARSVPLSGAALVDRARLEELVDDLRDQLPDELRQARWILKERDELLDQAQREADRLAADARDEHERLVGDAEVTKAAERRAEELLAAAREEAKVLRLEAEDYVDAELASFEATLERTLRTVAQGREQLRRTGGTAGPSGGSAAADGADRARSGFLQPGAGSVFDHEAPPDR